jgi:hypothetical protein
MNAKDLLSHELLRLPKDRDKEDYPSYLEALFDDFARLIDEVIEDNAVSRQIVAARDQSKQLSRSIIAAIRRYYEGHPRLAYQAIDDALKSAEPLVNSLCRADNIARELQYLYRMRVEDPSTTFLKRDLFHIPFDQRHKIKTQRFSIPGLPCLYLGGSLYVCWEELGRPALDRIHASHFSAARGSSIRVLNLALRPQHLARHLRPDALAAKTADELNLIASCAVFWPLFAACHVRVRHRDGAFIPEYIIPQILLQWVRNNKDLEGLCYSSTRIEDTFTQPYAQTNFAFPAREVREAGHCPSLIADFEFSAPLSWQFASIVDGSEWKRDTAPPDETYEARRADYIRKYGDYPVKVAEGITCNYSTTAFFMTQFKLNSLPRARLTTP